MTLNRSNPHYLLHIIIPACFLGASWAAAASVSSPHGHIKLNVEIVQRGDASQVVYEVTYRDRPLVAPSAIRFVRRDGAVIGDDVTLLSSTEPVTHRTTWTPVYGERSTVEDHYQQITVRLHDHAAECQLTLVFRCYDAGVAFHARLGTEDAGQEMAIKAELTEFRFHDDHTAWRTLTAQGDYEERQLSNLGIGVERPLVLRAADDVYVAIAEAKLVDYARMKLRKVDGSPHTLVSELSSRVIGPAPLTTPWRVVMIGNSPGELLENNDILLNLNDPCAIEDTSWIKPGKVLREITLTTAGGKACIDFAAKYNIQYVEFDAGWYGHEYDEASDATTITLDPKRSAGPLDLHYLIDYASERDIGVILYVNRRALERQLDEILPLYRQWGVRGVKFGFVNVGSQEWTTWLHEAVRKAAEYRLMVDVHDEYRPTGYSRTYPNLLTQEGVNGDEGAPSAEQTLTTLFTRSLAGPSDFTICYFDDRVDRKWSHGHQLAKATCFYSPWQFVFWYDTPLGGSSGARRNNGILETPELEYFKQMPTVWDDTRVLHGEIGKYAVIARRSGDRWFVGALNGSEPRSLAVPLQFLEPGQPYAATIYQDDTSAATATQVGIQREEVDSETTLTVRLQVNAGQAMILEPVAE